MYDLWMDGWMDDANDTVSNEEISKKPIHTWSDMNGRLVHFNNHIQCGIEY